MRHFIAYYEGEIAAAGTLFLSNDSVMLHNLATRATFQKRGIGAALTYHMMKEAQIASYTHCFLDSSIEAFDLYRRLGFKVYCTTLAYNKQIPT